MTGAKWAFLGRNWTTIEKFLSYKVSDDDDDVDGDGDEDDSDYDNFMNSCCW
jgi:hypothetical protein